MALRSSLRSIAGLRPFLRRSQAVAFSHTLSDRPPSLNSAVHGGAPTKLIAYLPPPRIPSFHPGANGTILISTTNFNQNWNHYPMSLFVHGAHFSTEASKEADGTTDTVQELYGNMLKSLEARTMPPNAWLWSLVKHCANKEDIKLLFQILQKLRIFRLSNLRIHANFNCHLCMRVSEACARAGAIDYGIKALWKHNVFGLTPSIGSAHYLLSYAREHKDIKAMIDIMEILRKNSLPLQPGTADIIFSICYSSNRWDLISKYAKEFIKAGVKLHRTAYDIWMEFAAKIGDSQSVWKIEKLRAKHVKQTTLACGFACAKGYLLEQNPANAASAIYLLYQNLPDNKKSGIHDELQKLVNEWRHEVAKRRKKDKELAESLKRDISAMTDSLLNMGLNIPADKEALKC